jgi:hypothetical protein
MSIQVGDSEVKEYCNIYGENYICMCALLQLSHRGVLLRGVGLGGCCQGGAPESLRPQPPTRHPRARALTKLLGRAWFMDFYCTVLRTP